MNKKTDPDKEHRIINAALDIYTETPDSFTMKSIAKKARIKETEIYSYFPNKAAILKSFYSRIVPAYLEMIKDIEGYSTYDLSEKLSNFIYSSIDIMQEKRDFVEKTFEPFIIRPPQKSVFQENVEKLIEDFISADSRISASNQYLMNSYTYHLLSKEYFNLILFWIHDESPGSEKTMALTDKVTGLLNAVLYSAVLEKGLDLGKFLITNRIFHVKLPLWETCVERFANKGVFR